MARRFCCFGHYPDSCRTANGGETLGVLSFVVFSCTGNRNDTVIATQTITHDGVFLGIDVLSRVYLIDSGDLHVRISRFEVSVKTLERWLLVNTKPAKAVHMVPFCGAGLEQCLRDSIRTR